MKFTKMQGAGNDYIYVDASKEIIYNPQLAAKELSDRHFGIGSDGLVLIHPSEIADFRMQMFNSDGSESEMCGNAIRCVAKYVFDKKMTDKHFLSIETLSGIKNIDLILDNGEVSGAVVDMGAPILNPKLIPVDTNGDSVVNYPLEIDGTIYRITCVSMGNPHCVVFCNNLNDLDMNVLGSKFENHKMFPKHINTEFVQVINKKNIDVRVWERGAGETLACGTGACASVVAGCLNGLTDTEVAVNLRGGTLKIKFNDTVIMSGNAITVFEGEVNVWY